MRRLLVWLMTCAAIAGLVAGCKKQDSRTVKVGVVLPLSGALTSYGKGALDGIRLAVQQVNNAGGVAGRPIELVVEDDKNQQTDARNAFKKLAEVDDVVAVIGPLTSTCALSMRLDAEHFKVPMLSPTATNDKVTEGLPYVFRTCFNDSFQGRVIASFVAGQLDVRSAAIMVDKTSDYSKGLSASFRQAFLAAGGQVAAEESYQQGDKDFGSQLNHIKASGAGILFVPGYPPEVPMIIKQAKVVGYPNRLCGADGWDEPRVIQESGDNIEGCYLVGAFSPEDQRPIVRKFVADIASYTQGRTTSPGNFEALGYDSVMLLVEAMKQGISREQIRAGLAGTKDFEAVTGRITINARHDAEKNAAILKIVKDGNTYAKKYVTTVSPGAGPAASAAAASEAATGQAASAPPSAPAL